MPNKRNKKRKNPKRGRDARGPMEVVIRDPLDAENEQNLGDLKQLAPRFHQPKFSNQIYAFSRRVGSSDVTQAAGADAFMAYRFQVNDLSNTADFSGLFDQYRFQAVKFEMRPRFNFSNPGSVVANKLPRLYSVIDYDDANVPTLITDLREYQSCKVTDWSHDHVRLIKPRLAGHVLNAAGGVSLSNESSNLWVDMGSLTVTYYGIKLGIEGGVMGQTNLQSWSVELTYYIEFRQVR